MERLKLISTSLCKNYIQNFQVDNKKKILYLDLTNFDIYFWSHE